MTASERTIAARLTVGRAAQPSTEFIFMKIKSLSTFNGPGGSFVKANDILDVDKSVAKELIVRGMAEVVDAEPAQKPEKKK